MEAESVPETARADEGAAQEGAAPDATSADAAPPPRPTVAGRLVQGVAVADSLGAQVTVRELREFASTIIGKPLYFEHSDAAGPVGRITSAHVDGDGWLWIRGELDSEHDKPGMEFPAFMRESLKRGDLRDFSISYTYPVDKQRRRIGPRKFKEASLVARGAYKGTHLCAVQASGHSSSSGSAPSGTNSGDDQIIERYIAPASILNIRVVKMSANNMNGVADGYDAQKIIADLAAQGITISPADVEGKTIGEVLQLIARSTAEARAKSDAERKKTEEMLQRAEAVIKRDEEAYRKQMEPEIERVKQIAAAAGYKGEIGLKVAQELMLDRESTEPAELFRALAAAVEKNTSALSEREKAFAALQAEKEALATQFNDFRTQTQAAQSRKRTFQDTPHPTPATPNMAAGGATANAATGAGAPAGAGAAAETVSVEASGSKRAVTGSTASLGSVHESALSADAFAHSIALARRHFPSANIASSLADGSAPDYVKVAASDLSMSGGFRATDQTIAKRMLEKAKRAGMFSD